MEPELSCSLRSPTPRRTTSPRAPARRQVGPDLERPVEAPGRHHDARPGVGDPGALRADARHPLEDEALALARARRHCDPERARVPPVEPGPPVRGSSSNRALATGTP